MEKASAGTPPPVIASNVPELVTPSSAPTVTASPPVIATSLPVASADDAGDAVQIEEAERLARMRLFNDLKELVYDNGHVATLIEYNEDEVNAFVEDMLGAGHGDAIYESEVNDDHAVLTNLFDEWYARRTAAAGVRDASWREIPDEAAQVRFEALWCRANRQKSVDIRWESRSSVGVSNASMIQTFWEMQKIVSSDAELDAMISVFEQELYGLDVRGHRFVLRDEGGHYDALMEVVKYFMGRERAH